MKAILQKKLAYKHKIKKQYKHVIVFPAEAVSELHWKGSKEVELTAQKGRLMLDQKVKNN